MTNKMTAEDLLAQKKNKRDALREKWIKNKAYAELQAQYAENAQREYETRVRQVEAMEARIEAGKAARAEADALRGPHIEKLGDESYRKSAEGKAMGAKILELDTFYHETTTEVAKINNGSF